VADHSYDPNWKLRIVVDETLAPGQQVAQALHAAIEFLFEHPELSTVWHNLSNSVVAMNCSSEELHALISRCEQKEAQYSVFREPDMDHRLTAVCIEPTRTGKKLTSNYKLAMRDL
jgi:hypothetical protein